MVGFGSYCRPQISETISSILPVLLLSKCWLEIITWRILAFSSYVSLLIQLPSCIRYFPDFFALSPEILYLTAVFSLQSILYLASSIPNFISSFLLFQCSVSNLNFPVQFSIKIYFCVVNTFSVYLWGVQSIQLSTNAFPN